MAFKKFYVGSSGPFYYDDSENIGDPDGDFSGQLQEAFVTEGQVFIGTEPTEEGHVALYETVQAEDMLSFWLSVIARVV